MLLSTSPSEGEGGSPVTRYVRLPLSHTVISNRTSVLFASKSLEVG
jgi:hypothetical protein